jgi:hypothetical protein
MLRKTKILNQKGKNDLKKSICWKLWTYSFTSSADAFDRPFSKCPCPFSRFVCWVLW